MITIDDKRKKQLREASSRWKKRKLAENPNFFREQYQKNLIHRQDYERRNKDRIKTEVLTYYGNGLFACVICGESRLHCLSIDHINGNGSLERKRLGKAGLGFYYWLKKQGYPEGYRTLCMNCQFIERNRIYEERLAERRLISSQ